MTGRTSDEPAPEHRGRRVAELRFLVPSLFGFAFTRAYYDVVAAYMASFIPGMPWAGQDLVVMGMVPAFLLCVVMARRLLPLSSMRGAGALSCAFMTAGTALLALAPAFSETKAPFAIMGALVAGLGVGVSILLWAELQSCWNSFQIALYVSGAFFVGSFLGWLMLGMSEPQRLVAMLVLPALSWACLGTGRAHVAEADLPGGFSGGLQFPWKLVVALGVYELVLGVRQSSVSFSDGALTVGVLASSAALFLVIYFLSHRFDFTLLFRTPFVLMSCGLLATLVSMSSDSLAADMLVSIGYALMFLVLTILLCDVAHRLHVSAALLCSIQELVMLANLAGHGAGAALASGTHASSPAILVGLAVLIIVASMTLLTEREYARWGAALFGMGELAGAQEARDDLGRRCEELADAHALSPREREVFRLLAAGEGAADIERALCIAEGTLKSHTRRIYRKLGIHSREELEAMVRA